MKLPEEYITKMTDLLGEEGFKAYAESLDKPRMFGLRLNTLKIQADDFVNKFKDIIGIKAGVPWEADGYYYETPDEAAAQPGKLPFYHAGLYYIQEPSAMYPAAQLGVRPGDRVLDMCAAPGGKSTKIACELKGEGLLVANDINEERVKALIYNIELSGAPNVIVTNESPERLAESLPGYFDRIIVDAPCSGEGMFRKDDEAVKSWGVYKNEMCASMQREILEYADILLKNGGRIMYSTCTFDPSEDEEMIRGFMERHSEYVLVPLVKKGGVEDGMLGMDECARLWPHKLGGEGHFAALLEKRAYKDRAENEVRAEEVNTENEVTVENEVTTENEANTENAEVSVNEIKSSIMKPRIAAQAQKTKSYKLLEAAPSEFKDFWKENMTGEVPEGIYYTAADALYYLPCCKSENCNRENRKNAGIADSLHNNNSDNNSDIDNLPPNVDGLKVPKLGLRLGEIPSHEHCKSRARGCSDYDTGRRPRAGKFRPSQQLCMAFGNSFKRKIRLPYDGEDIKRYLRGETLTGIECIDNGLTAVCVEDYAVGMGTVDRGVLKNLYPKGWRRMI